MNTQNVEQSEGSSIFSSMVNAFVLITIASIVIFPLYKKFKEQMKLNKKEAASSQSSQKQTSSVTQGPHNSQTTSENQCQLSSGQTSQNLNQNGANQPSAQRSMQNIQQWSDKNEQFKHILEQEDHQITCIDEYNSQIKKFIGQKINFSVKSLFAELKKKNLQANSLTFDFLLQIVLDNKRVECALELFIIFQNQIQNIYTITPSIISLFLKAIQFGVTHEINPDDAELLIEQLNTVAEQFSIKLTEGNKIAMIDIALRSNKLEKAMKIFNDLEKDQSWNTKEDIKNKRCDLYYQILKNIKGIFCVGADDILIKLCSMIEYLYEQKEHHETYPDEIMINSLIEMCFQCNQAKQALDIYEYFDKFNISPSGVTYCILIKGYGQLQQYGYAMTVYDLMTKNKIPLNEITLGCLIDTCVKCNQLEKAEQILADEKNIKPNTIIYTTLLKGYTKLENMKKALEIFEIMKSDKDLEPNIVTYNSLMECAVQCKDKEQMKKIFNEIKKQKDESKKADLITYSTYIKGLFKYGDIDEALEIFEDLRKQDSLKLDEVFYNSILDGLFKAKEYQKTQLLYQKMRTDNIKPSNVTYSILVRLNSAQGKIDEAQRIFQEMKKQNVKPGLIVYTCLIQACIKHKHINQLLPLYEDMKKQSVRGDAVFYNTLVSGLLFNRCVNDAFKMTIDTLERRIILNQEVYQNLLQKVINNYEKRKTLGDAYIPNIGQSSSQIEDELTFQEIEKYLQKTLSLLRKYQIEINTDLFKQVVNHAFANNSTEKNEYLSYASQKRESNNNRQNWDQNKPSYGSQSKSGSSNPTNSYRAFYNKQKIPSFYQKQKGSETGTLNEIPQDSMTSFSDIPESGNKNSFRNNGGYNGSAIGGTTITRSQNRNLTYSHNAQSQSQSSFSGFTSKRFLHKQNNTGAISITDLKKSLEDEKDNEEQQDVVSNNIGFKSTNEKKRSSVERAKESLTHITMDECENDSQSSEDLDSGKKDREVKNNAQANANNARKKLIYKGSSFRNTVAY